MEKQEIIKKILKLDYEVKKSFLNIEFLIFKITHLKAVNILLKNGFINSPNNLYIIKDDIIIKKKPLPKYKKFFIIEK